MSYRRSRKRRRSQAFPHEEEEEEQNAEEVAVAQDEDAQQRDLEDGESTTEEVRKEIEIWDAFREEHYEAIEQLPLSLHRQYTLLLELDEQAQGYHKELLPTIQRYIKLRRALVSRPENKLPEQSQGGGVVIASKDVEMVAKSEPPLTPIQNLLTPLNGNGSSIHPSSRQSEDHGTPISQTKMPRLASLAATRTPTPMSIPPDRTKLPQTTREMLSHIAWLSEEVLRASQEKVNLAQAACDSVDRHIRLLDQSIKEQEASIALGVRPGTHLAPIILPEIIVPGSRPARPVHSSPMPEEADGDEEPTLGMVGGDEPGEVPARPRGRGGRKGRGRPRKETEIDEVPVTTRSRSHGGGTRSSKVTVPEELPPAPEEERYCYCNQVSFGEMVACDNENCEREWFHLGCVGLEQPPGDEESWYCRDCQHLAKGTKTMKTRRRKRR